MNKRASPPLRHHPNWLPFVEAVELVLRQVGDPDQAMKDAISALDSGVPCLVVVHGVRRLVTSTDKLKIQYPTYWDDDEQERLTEGWRDETAIELSGERVLLFVWRPKLEEFLGLRPAAAREEQPPPVHGETKKRAKSRPCGSG